MIKTTLAALAFAAALAPASPAHAWGKWMGDVSACPAPEKQSFMNSMKKDSPYCTPRGGCAAGRHRVELIDSSGFEFFVCVKEGVQPPPVALKLECEAPERLAYRNPLERSGAFCAAAKRKCAGTHTLESDKDTHGLSISKCSGGAGAAPKYQASHAQEKLTCPEPESVAQRKDASGAVVQFCAPGAVKDDYKFSHQMACGQGRREHSIDDYTTDPAYPRQRRACQ